MLRSCREVTRTALQSAIAAAGSIRCELLSCLGLPVHAARSAPSTCTTLRPRRLGSVASCVASVGQEWLRQLPS
jgi:hypothetical protein